MTANSSTEYNYQWFIEIWYDIFSELEINEVVIVKQGFLR